jgi:hypothetical protein
VLSWLLPPLVQATWKLIVLVKSHGSAIDAPQFEAVNVLHLQNQDSRHAAAQRRIAHAGLKLYVINTGADTTQQKERGQGEA